MHPGKVWIWLRFITKLYQIKSSMLRLQFTKVAGWLVTPSGRCSPCIRGMPEVYYQRALAEELQCLGKEVEMEKRFKAYYKGTFAGMFRCDLGCMGEQWSGSGTTSLVVENAVIVELKAVPLNRHHVGQLLSYLRGAGLLVGYLLYFGGPQLQFKRLVMSYPITPVV